ncbi:MAG: DDE-type integrase/transposase/recombinase [Deltaproteobacteria bacterium]|nr:DDE-type integrase/transposase/recombinase [Deltaproteobacteria bacterium]MBT8371444.1 DDE-type integrase/transposase/recombinase [Deltaproteobacteria bacterium]
MDKEQEKWAIFWCDLLTPVIYQEIEAQLINRYLKQLAQKKIRFPDGRIGKPSLSTLRRKFNRYRQGGFDALARKRRSDHGKSRNVAAAIINKAVELKKEQPFRSPDSINRLLEDMYGLSVPRSTLYRHLKQANATRLKLGVLDKKVRKRWTRNHTHDLWVGDFEDGPYVLQNGQVVPTYLSAFIDCHSRYVVEARYYFRQNLDVLIDSLIRALSTHGAPLQLYVDRAKIYLANSLQAACYRLNIKLLHRPPKDPPAGGLIERLIQTIQTQLEAEIRAGDILTLQQLNRCLSAWQAVSYHKTIHSETKQSPEQRYQNGLTVIRSVDMAKALESFMQSVHRTVNRTFSDVQLNKRFYRVDPKLRGDRVQVKYDPFSSWDTVHIHSLAGQYLASGTLHDRTSVIPASPRQTRAKPKHSYTELLIRQHKQMLAEQTGSIDYRKVVQPRPWPFHEFAKTVAQLMGKKAGVADLSAGQLESLKKVYNQSLTINRQMVKQAFEKALYPTLPYIIRELKQLIRKEAQNVS